MLAKHLTPALGEYGSDKLTAAAVADWRKEKADDVECGRLARKSFNNLLNLLHIVIGWAWLGAELSLAYPVRWGDGKHGGRPHIRRSLYQGDVTRPKTANSERVVDVLQSVRAALTTHLTAQPAMAGDFVFHTASGTPKDPDNFYKRVFADIRKRAQLRAVELHALGIRTLACSFSRERI
jgi:hypothetical protein